MQLSDLYSSLCSIGVPAAYHHFETEVEPPYIVYFDDGGEARGADEKNNINEADYVIELYSLGPDMEIEDQIGKLLNSMKVKYSWDRTWIDTEGIYQTTYDFHLIEKMEG